MNKGAPSLASTQPQVLQVRMRTPACICAGLSLHSWTGSRGDGRLQVQHEELCTPSTVTRPPYTPASPISRAKTLRSLGGASCAPRALLRDLLTSLTSLLQQEYRYVFNHNLGVHSGWLLLACYTLL